MFATIALAGLTLSAAALAVGLIYYRRKYTMSQASEDRLKAAAKAAEDKLAAQEATIKSLTDQLAAAGTASVPDAAVDAVSAELEQAVNPPAPAPAPAPEPPPAA